MYGYTSKRPGGIFTHVVSFNQQEYSDMVDHSHCYSNSDFDPLQASFIHLDEKNYNDFIETFKIELIETKKELEFLKQLTQ